MVEKQRIPRIGIDMDGVIADALPKHLALYNAEFHTRLTLDDLHGQRLGDVVHADHRARLEEYLAAEDFFADLPVIADSVDVIRELKDRYEVFITSAAMDVPASFAAKFEPLRSTSVRRTSPSRLTSGDDNGRTSSSSQRDDFEVCKMEQPPQTQTCYCSRDFWQLRFPVVDSKMEIPE